MAIYRSMLQLNSGTDGTHCTGTEDPGLVSRVVNPGNGSEFRVPGISSLY